MLLIGTGCILISLPLLYVYLLSRPGTLPGYQPHWPAYAVGAVIATLFQFGVVVPVSISVAKDNLLTQNELYAGNEAFARVVNVPCERDGSCVHTFKCDVEEDDDGDETGSHQCPTVKTEVDYVIDTTIVHDDKPQFIPVATGLLPEHPQRWVSDQFLGFATGDSPSKNDFRELVSELGTAPPQAWLDADKRIRAHRPRLVQMKFTYKDPVHAADETTQRQASAMVPQFVKVIPDHPDYAPDSRYLATKVYFMGDFKPANRDQWQSEAQNVAASLGTRQGDYQMVIIQGHGLADQATAYVNAWKAHWQRKQLGRNSISKNAMMVAIWTPDGKTVGWAAGTTGMPGVGGNPDLLQRIPLLAGRPLTPADILGHPQIEIVPKGNNAYGAKVTSSGSIGTLEDMLLFGDHPFVRKCMYCEDEDEVASGSLGFGYLNDEVKLGAGSIVSILIVDTLVMAIFWAVIFALVFNFLTIPAGNDAPRYRSGGRPFGRRTGYRVRNFR